MKYMINDEPKIVEYKLFIPQGSMLTKKFPEMSKSEAQQFFNWFIEGIHPRLEQLKNLIAMANDGTVEKMDYSPGSLVDVFTWFLKSVNVVEKGIEQYEKECMALPEFLRYQVAHKQLELEWMQVINDIGVYMALCFSEYDERLKWGIAPYPKAAGGNSPAIIGFQNKMFFSPMLMMNVVMGKAADGRATNTSLFDTFNTWIKKLPPGRVETPKKVVQKDIQISQQCKSANKETPNEKTQLNEILHTLAELEIKPKREGFVEHVLESLLQNGENNYEIEYFKEDPYSYILSCLGGDYEYNNDFERLSDDVYLLDAECVEDDSIYADIVSNLIVLSRGNFNISDVKSAVDYENEKAYISFLYKGIPYFWDLKCDNDWLDMSLFKKINQLLQENASTMFFYTTEPDQAFTVLFKSPEVIDRVNQLVKFPFKCFLT